MLERLPRGHAVSRLTVWLVTLLATVSTSGAATGSPRYKIHVVDNGVYRVSYDDLANAGGLPDEIPSARLGMSNGGTPVPLWVADGGDGRFGPGDQVEFVAERLAGERGYYHEFGELNVYWLDTGATSPARMKPFEPSGVCEKDPPSQYRSLHLEQDRLRVRFSGSAADDQEVWFWNRLTPLDERPTTIRLPLDDLDSGASGSPLELRAHFRGWSHLPVDASRSSADHHVELTLNGKRLGNVLWDNRADGFTLEVAVLPAALRAGENTLELRVPERRPAAGGPPAVDVVLLNWIDVRYSRRPSAPDRPIRLDAIPGDCLTFRDTGEQPLLLYGADGSRLRLLRGALEATGWRPGGEVHVLPEGAWREAVRVTRERPSSWSSAGRRADYLIVSHRSLIDAVRPLAEFHRGRGLRVEVVDVEDVYDEFNHGVVHPRAIRDFLVHAHDTWQSPAPRFVLLVGDASWDPRNPEADDANYYDWTYRPQHGGVVVKNDSSPYAARAVENHRNLVPAWTYATYEGHAASDHGFVDFGDGEGPAMAIGRFPVTEPEEVAAIVAKTIRYAARPADGAWRERILWITNEQRGFQERSDRLAETLDGFAARRIYPTADEPSNEQHRLRLREAFDEGQLLVHFYGHGGRYIWRTGPPDLQKNHDLFTLDDLDELRPNERLPVVLSMTCYSAPFDHPNADSIGEKLLRVPGRGAVAVVAASWRNSPSFRWSEILLSEFTREATIGEAFLRAKQRSTHEEFLRQYNLLGDPAAPLAVTTGRTGGSTGV